LLCNDAVVTDGHVVGGNPLDQALWEAPEASTLGLDGFRRLAVRPFDYQCRVASVLVEDANRRRMLIVKGAPELVLSRCRRRASRWTIDDPPPAAAVYLTTSTSDDASTTSSPLTEPNSRRRTTPRWREPTTIRSAPVSRAASRIATTVSRAGTTVAAATP
jgi:magnesium-transporting ATPase (P-type)